MPGESRPPFAPGNPGNPTGGRPKKTEEMRRAEDLMRSRSEDGVRQLIDLSERSEDDNVRARLLQFRYEAVFGKASQAITGPEGEPLLPGLDGLADRVERMIAARAPRVLDAVAVETPALPEPKK